MKNPIETLLFTDVCTTQSNAAEMKGEQTTAVHRDRSSSLVRGLGVTEQAHAARSLSHVKRKTTVSVGVDS
jgi:hypothetical protein